MDLGLDGDVALTTASSAGLGGASAESLAREGAHVTICGRDPDRLAAAEAELASVGPGDVLALRADVTDSDDVERLVSETVERFGGLDHLVTSAGGPPPGNVLDLTDEDWYAAYDLLVMSVVRAVRAAHPHLADGGGTITCIASRTVREPSSGLVLSNAVRRGVIGLVKTVAREFAPAVRTNAVLPGPFETSRIEGLVEHRVETGEYESYEAGLDGFADDVPVGRVGDPRELGDTVAYLASDRAGFVNGVALPVDGGAIRS
jgi:NAD(P)-dependent dehydrogenase (short-subunit alcohol dehydrogenase family)